MEKVDILANYRKVLSDDKNAIEILSTILLYGKANKNQIERKLNISRADLLFKLIELYRSNLIQEIDEEEWKTTPLSESILEEFGIKNILSKTLLDIFNFSETDRVFLNACLDFQDSSKEVSLTDIINLLRTLLQFQDFWKLFYKKGELKELNRRYTYAIIINSDLKSRTIGGEKYASEVIKYHTEINSDTWRKHQRLIIGEMERIQSYCHFSLRDNVDSNVSLYEGRLVESNESEVNFYITTNRYLGAVVNQKLDEEIKTISWNWNKKPKEFRLGDSIENYKTGFFEKLTEFIPINNLIQAESSSIRIVKSKLSGFIDQLFLTIFNNQSEPSRIRVLNLDNQIFRNSLFHKLPREDKISHEFFLNLTSIREDLKNVKYISKQEFHYLNSVINSIKEVARAKLIEENPE